MTLDELETMGFIFEADFYRYRVRYKKPSPFNTIGQTVSNVSFRLPDSKENMLERARLDAIRYFVATRLSQ